MAPTGRSMRAARLEELASGTFDLLVVGGGSVGAGVALEASVRGLRVALAERLDYASGASGRSTKLLHGGVRYLERAVRRLDRGEWRLVRDALAERTAIFRQAPHLCRPLGILAPAATASQRRYYALGLGLYDHLAGSATLGATRVLSPNQARDAFPQLAPGLAGGVLYYDGQFDDARLNLALILTAERYGATCVNHAEVTGLRRDGGRMSGAEVTDRLSGNVVPVAARMVLNAAGPFADAVRALDGAPPPLVQPSSGVHIVVPGDVCPPGVGLLVPRTDDGRVAFLLPWQGHTLLGTTDDPAAPEAHPPVRAGDVSHLLAQVRPYIARPINPQEVRSAWSGIRPLVRDPRRPNTAALSRDHVVLDEAGGMVTVAGGKWTTYRRIAHDAVEHLARHGMPVRPAPADPIPLIGSDGFSSELPARLVDAGLPPPVAEHLAATYGGRAADLLRAAAGDRQPLVAGHPYLEAEVTWAAQHEHAQAVMDVLARRIRLAFLDRNAARVAVPRTATLLGGALGWNRQHQEAEARVALAELDGNL